LLGQELCTNSRLVAARGKGGHRQLLGQELPKKENKEIAKIATSSSLWQGLPQAVAEPRTSKQKTKIRKSQKL
jgi:hypothetical protein